MLKIQDNKKKFESGAEKNDFSMCSEPQIPG